MLETSFFLFEHSFFCFCFTSRYALSPLKVDLNRHDSFPYPSCPHCVGSLLIIHYIVSNLAPRYKATLVRAMRFGIYSFNLFVIDFVMNFYPTLHRLIGLN